MRSPSTHIVCSSQNRNCRLINHVTSYCLFYNPGEQFLGRPHAYHCIQWIANFANTLLGLFEFYTISRNGEGMPLVDNLPGNKNSHIVFFCLVGFPFQELSHGDQPAVRHRGLMVSATAWDGTGCEFDSCLVSDIFIFYIIHSLTNIQQNLQIIGLYNIRKL